MSVHRLGPVHDPAGGHRRGEVRLGDRRPDARIAPDAPPAEYRKRVWAKNHRSAPEAKEFLDPKDAAEVVAQGEKAYPEMIPAGFRAQLLASPKDPKLRLRMARCEETSDV